MSADPVTLMVARRVARERYQDFMAWLREGEQLAADFPGYLGSGGNTWRTTPGGAIRHGDWKLIEFFEKGRRELYNLQDDPGERNDLASESPERAKTLGDELASWRTAVGAKMPTPNEPDPDAKRDRKNRKKQRRAQRRQEREFHGGRKANASYRYNKGN